jgi:hypothetical protein
VEILKMDDFEEKVWKYLVEHKTPVQVKTLARRWIVSDSRVRIVFEKLIADVMNQVMINAVDLEMLEAK